MTLYQIGSITLPAVWIAVVIALAVVALTKRLISGEKVGEWFWNAFTMYFLVWKASYILFNFDEFLNFPMSVLYFNGGASGHLLAIAAVTFYLRRAVKKYPELHQDALPVLLLFFTGFEAALNILEKQMTASVLHIILFVGVALFLYASRKKTFANRMQIQILFVLAVLLVLSVFQPLLSIQPLTFSWLALTAFVLEKFRKREVVIHE